ncbi:venom allergen 5-like, partial [Copidosoma floridanum]|uniref:venom allergen 5-like n=1 Tax=Copidosoma floridanum TaxID=29053 RepID=UPI000C6F74BE
LNKHNELRDYVAQGSERRGAPGPQPAAKNMQRMVWDNELEKIAQTWANQCSFEHDTCRNVGRFSVGQNIYQAGTSGDPRSINVVQAVDSWYKEVVYFDRNDVRQFRDVNSRNGKVVGHYTQLVWANSDRLGCGSRNYDDGKYKWKYIVCNYGPTGNWIRQSVYQPR